MIYNETVRLDIINGPSKMDLMAALAYAYDNARSPFLVTFLVTGNKDAWRQLGRIRDLPLRAKIIGLAHEDGSGESFIIHGYIDSKEYKKEPYLPDGAFKGYYHSKTRKGHMMFGDHDNSE